MLELLAPSGDINSFDAAIACGADAVYLGLDGFNARMKAENFNADDLRECIKKAHFYGVKVYITVNTILQNGEFNDLFTLIKAAFEAKADAYIVQDLGVATALRRAFKGICLHASTQLGVHDLYGAKIAEAAGFKRVVLSRETKLEDIKEIAKNTGLEIEFFVQGALCVCFSGNCYMSAKEQSASGNRGLCKQLCRLSYEAVRGDKRERGYLLSARDLCLADSLKDLADAGVTSFKIEGRMRRESYVGESVAVYRKLLDSIAEGKETKLCEEDETRLKKAYSRGEYSYRAYLDEGTPDIIEKRFNNHTGIKIGKVVSVKPFKDGLFEVVISSSRALKKGDGLKFFDGDKERASLGIGEPKVKGKGLYAIVTKTAVKAGQGVSLIADGEADACVLQAKRYLPIKLSLQALAGKPMTIAAEAEIRDAGGNKVIVRAEKKSDTVLEVARNAAVCEEELRAQCSKTADSGFAVQECKVQTDGIFVAKSALNALRREILDALKEAVISEYEKNMPCNIDNDEYAAISCEAQKCARSENCEGGNSSDSGRPNYRIVKSEDLSRSILLKKGEKVVLSLSRYTKGEILKMMSALDIDDGVILQLPVIANGKDLKVIEELLAALPNIKTLLSENIYGLYFARKGYEVIAGAGHNAANVFAYKTLKALGAKSVLPSPEYKDAYLSADDIGSIDGDMPLMYFAHCPFKTLDGSSCAECTYRDGLKYVREKHEYRLRRIVVSQCYFALYP